MKRRRFKGIVKNNVVVLENDARLAEGAIVEVRVKDPERDARLQEKNRKAIEQILAHPIQGPVGMAEIIEEEKREREERWDYMFGGENHAEPQKPPAA
jgi:hypothetical protein